MRPSFVGGFTVTPGRSAILIAHATDRPCRVLVQSTGFTFVSYDASMLNQNLANGVPASGVFVLKPGQSLYGATSSAGAELSVAWSEAPDVRPMPASAMQASRMGTIQTGAASGVIGTTQGIPIATAGALPRRVLVIAATALGFATDCFVATEPGASNFFHVTSGSSATFILAPGQTLYAYSNCSYASSDVIKLNRTGSRLASSRALVAVTSSYLTLARASDEEPLLVRIAKISAVSAATVSHDAGVFPAPVVSTGGIESVVSAPATGPGLFLIPRPTTANLALEFYLAPGQVLMGGTLGPVYDVYTSAIEGDPLGYSDCEYVVSC